jgi:hypothetical protein
MCRTERRKDKREGREVTIIAVLADLGRWKAICAIQKEERIRESEGRYPCFVS